MPVVETKGSASSQGFGEFAKSGGAANYIEDVFSTYLYTGNGSTQTITNGIDLSGKGGAVWFKRRDGAENHEIYDTNRGVGNRILPNLAIAQASGGTLSAFNSNGFSMIADGNTNQNTFTYASWTFREQAKFFDVVTYTGNGGSNTAISHSLGSVPGCYIIKATSTTSNWYVYHRGADGSGGGAYINQSGILNSTAAFAGSASDGLMPSSTAIYVVDSGSTTTSTNSNGVTYVAYLFAHNAGGFGLTGTDNVISCGSYTGNGSATGPVITLGYEPQWLLVKRASGTADSWFLFDSMRGFPNASSGAAILNPNNSDAEGVFGSPAIIPTATGFQPITASTSFNASGATYIYIAIRRGPMKTPTSGTSVFSPIAVNAPNSTQQTTNFPVDMQLFRYRSGADSSYAVDRLRGVTTSVSTSNSTPFLIPNATDAEGTFQVTNNWNNTGFAIPAGGWGNINNIFWSFRRAPSFMDVVCYTGTGVARTVNHNLGVAPELMIVKTRTQINSWAVYLGGPLGGTKTANLNQTYAAYDSSGHWNNTQPTASVFSIGNNGEVNDSGVTYVNYLFASCAGVSKVGSYSGTGTTKQIDCGFTGGARFVLIKRTDSTGDWYVWDSARGIVAGNDPYLLLNSTAAEVTNTDYVDTYSAGFEISSTAPAAINANGGTFIFLAVA